MLPFRIVSVSLHTVRFFLRFVLYNDLQKKASRNFDRLLNGPADRMLYAHCDSQCPALAERADTGRIGAANGTTRGGAKPSPPDGYVIENPDLSDLNQDFRHVCQQFGRKGFHSTYAAALHTVEADDVRGVIAFYGA